MKKITTLLFLFVFIAVANAQRGYNTWQYLQDSESHLQAAYSQKRIKESLTGKRRDLYLKQETTYEDGFLASDIAYDRKTGQKLFDIQLNYTDSSEVTSVNLLDSSAATYFLTPANKVRYYVASNNSQQHVIYTYDSTNQVIRCKDCLQPLGNHEWCVYYQYQYNAAGKLVGVHNYNLAINTPVSDKILIQKDTFYYNTQQQLIKRESRDPTDNVLMTTSYTYNRKGLLAKEISTQSNLYQFPRSYTKTYFYHCNTQLQKQKEDYYKETTFNGSVISWYNKKGWKVKQKTYRDTKEVSRLYLTQYKK
jgi:hypothetical protein